MARILECTAEQYHADALSPVPTLNRSTALRIYDDSAFHAMREHPRLGGKPAPLDAEAEPDAGDDDEDAEDDDKPDADRGSIQHALMLAVHEDPREEIWFDEEVKVKGSKEKEIRRVCARDFKKKAARAARDAAKARGKIPCREGEIAAQNNANQRFRETLKRDFGIVPEDWQRELAIEFEDDGVLCRARLDLVVEYPEENRLVIYDFKFMKRGSAKTLLRSAISFGYDIEAHVHTKALEAIRPEFSGRVEFVMLACELGTWIITDAHLDGTMRAVGEKRWEHGREKWRHGLATGEWPAYDRIVLSAPTWLLQESGAEI